MPDVLDGDRRFCNVGARTGTFPKRAFADNNIRRSTVFPHTRSLILYIPLMYHLKLRRFNPLCHQASRRRRRRSNRVERAHRGVRIRGRWKRTAHDDHDILYRDRIVEIMSLGRRHKSIGFSHIFMLNLRWNYYYTRTAEYRGSGCIL